MKSWKKVLILSNADTSCAFMCADFKRRTNLIVKLTSQVKDCDANIPVAPGESVDRY